MLFEYFRFGKRIAGAQKGLAKPGQWEEGSKKAWTKTLARAKELYGRKQLKPLLECLGFPDDMVLKLRRHLNVPT